MRLVLLALIFAVCASPRSSEIDRPFLDALETPQPQPQGITSCKVALLRWEYEYLARGYQFQVEREVYRRRALLSLERLEAAVQNGQTPSDESIAEVADSLVDFADKLHPVE